MALVLLASALLASSASAAKKAPLNQTGYIALGDSLAFGYTQQKFEENYPAESPTAFEGGYVNLLAAKLKPLERKAGNELTTINLSCPGEVSDGLIGENTSLGGGQMADGTSDSAPCAWHNVDGFPRHYEYGSSSQLEAALQIGATFGNPATVPNITYATINIGSNDELAVVHACESQSYEESRGFTRGLDECLTVEAGEEGTYYEKGLFHHIISNVGDVIGVARHYGFTGKIGILGFYNPQAEILPGSDAIQKKLNETFEYEVGTEAFGPNVVYANPFPVFNPQTGHEEQRICHYTEECNKHDKHVNFVKYLEGKGMSHAEAEAYASQKESEGYEFPEGDIHPTPAGYKQLAKVLYTALVG